MITGGYRCPDCGCAQAFRSRRRGVLERL